MSTDVINLIFGMKLRQARLEANLSLTEFAARAELSPSYVTEMEKGRKYPKPDKIVKMAHVLGKAYDELVSIKLNPALAYLENMLSSPLLRHFPFEEFELDPNELVGLFTKAPDKASALLHAIWEIARQYDMKDEHFFRAALRSYQEIHENYFPEIEEEAEAFAAKYHLNLFPVGIEQLKQILQQQFGYRVDETTLADHELLSHYRAVYIDTPRKTLLINPNLYELQRKFILARELGYAALGLNERSVTSTPDQVLSFRQVSNDFKASYFGGALLMPRQPMIADISTLFNQTSWSAEPLLAMLNHYDVTPEMLLYRFSEVIPAAFGISLHFLRFHNVDGSYKLIKRINMNRLLLPSGIGLHEHYCRRWLASRLLINLSEQTGPQQQPLVDVQISQFLESQDRFLDIGFARPLVLTPTVGSSVVVGFRFTPELSKVIKFVDDPVIHRTVIHETCQRCPIDDCAVRKSVPTVLWGEQLRDRRNAAIAEIRRTLLP